MPCSPHPGQFPDGQSPDWNTNVLAQCGGVIDFVIVHWYPQEPGSESDSFLLNAPASQIGGMVSQLRALISQYCGANAAQVQIFVTETNSVAYNPGKQTVSLVNALFVADDYATWLEQGVSNVDLWDLHNGASEGNASGALYGSASYGDYGLLASGGSPEPAAETPFPAYDGLAMLSELGKAGDAFVSATSSQPLLGVHAVRQAGGNLALLLINKDPANSYAASVAVDGYTPAAGASGLFLRAVERQRGHHLGDERGGPDVHAHGAAVLPDDGGDAAQRCFPDADADAHRDPKANAHSNCNTKPHANACADRNASADRNADAGASANRSLCGQLRGEQPMEQRLHRQRDSHQQRHGSSQRLDAELELPGQPSHHQPLERQPQPERPEREGCQYELQRLYPGGWFRQLRLPGHLQRHQREPHKFRGQRWVIRYPDTYSYSHSHSEADADTHANAYPHPEAGADAHTCPYPHSDTEADTDTYPYTHAGTGAGGR